MATEEEKAAYAAKHYAKKEKDVEGDARDYAQKLGIWNTKYKSANNRGLPDRQFKIRNGPEFYIEFKRPTGKKAKPRKLQKLVIEEMVEEGFIVFVTNDIDEAKAIIYDMLTFGAH